MNINVTVNTSFTGIIVVNVKDRSKIINVKVQVISHNCTTFNNHPIEINGLRVFVHYYDKISKYGSLTIENFCYNNYKPCESHLLCVIVTLFLKNYDVSKNQFILTILNSVFGNLKNSRALCSYGVTTETSKTEYSNRIITIKNSTFSDNTGNP